MDKSTPKEETSIISTAEQAIAIPMMDIAELEKLTVFVAKVKETLMTEGRDYIIQGQKQYTSRSGFAKLAQGFNLSDEILVEKEITRNGEFYGFDFTVRVYNVYGRQATGVGSCSLDEPNLVHHKERPYHDCRSIAYTRAWNRAISNFVGSADVSAEEMSLGQDFERKDVDSEQRDSFPLPGAFKIPTWDFTEALKGEGWANLEEAFGAFVGDAGLDPEMFDLEKEPLRAIVKCKSYLGDSFGDIARMLAKAGFGWRAVESRFVLMKPEGVE